MTTTTETHAWNRVRGALSRAKGMHWDGCHKIYLSMDDEQLRQSEEIGYETHAPDFDKLKGWFEESCGLRFVNAVYTVEGDPNDGYEDLIAQFELEDDEEEA